MKSVRIRSFPGPHFPAFGLITERFRRIQYKCRKIRTRNIENTDNFHAVTRTATFKDITYHNILLTQLLSLSYFPEFQLI